MKLSCAYPIKRNPALSASCSASNTLPYDKMSIDIDLAILTTTIAKLTFLPQLSHSDVDNSPHVIAYDSWIVDIPVSGLVYGSWYATPYHHRILWMLLQMPNDYQYTNLRGINNDSKYLRSTAWTPSAIQSHCLGSTNRAECNPICQHRLRRIYCWQSIMTNKIDLRIFLFTLPAFNIFD